jgi:hypothetical protein
MSVTIDGSNGVQVPVVTTTQKNALTVTAGYIVFDSTLGKLCVYTGSTWQTITSA